MRVHCSSVRKCKGLKRWARKRRIHVFLIPAEMRVFTVVESIVKSTGKSSAERMKRLP